MLFNLYGSSELGLISLATPQDLSVYPNSVGLPLTDVQILPPNCIYVAGRNSGDTGFLQTGRLFLTGRQDEMLICGGMNVYPQALEQQIMLLEYLADCAVQGIPDLEYGQAIRLYVVLKKPVQIQQIQQDLALQLPRAMRPKEIVVVAQLPRTALGKLERHRLDYTHVQRPS